MWKRVFHDKATRRRCYPLNGFVDVVGAATVGYCRMLLVCGGERKNKNTPMQRTPNSDLRRGDVLSQKASLCNCKSQMQNAKPRRSAQQPAEHAAPDGEAKQREQLPAPVRRLGKKGSKARRGAARRRRAKGQPLLCFACWAGAAAAARGRVVRRN